MQLSKMNKAELEKFKEDVIREYEAFKARGLKLDMSRGKPSAEQLDLSMPMLDVLNSTSSPLAKDGTDCRNYGLVDGLPEAKEFFGKMLGVSPKETIVYGNSSLNLMYDTVVRAMLYGVPGSEKPWSKEEKIKFLAPSPGYDRHFGICESLGIELVTVPMLDDGPDMDMVEKLVSSDSLIKGIWCVPMYSNPEGITYSDEVVKRFANLSPAGKDFRIFWDNAYCIHHLKDTPDTLLNILDECKKAGKPNMVYIFGSTSKITFAGAGVAVMGASEENINHIKKIMSMQTIGHDKMNQLRHLKFFGTYENMLEHMRKHRQIIEPKFNKVLEALDKEIAPLGIASWKNPNGGYFISVDTLDGCAKRVVSLCKDAGVVLTGAGATFPYGIDPRDRNIRIAPTYPPLEELELAMQLFCICLKLASAEKLLNQ
ncbi:MAG: aminotransferase class I/II-fold pyridoxal phosphate-dependent enzyme [Oscillospiraceae bacterium]|nr:aminotransferase class I/II-fold pyridoxal phosphate-dependent enzyme [Oscillospiraceae bacterium]